MPDNLNIPDAEFGRSNPKAYGKQVQAVLNHLRESAYDRDDIWQFLAFAMGASRSSKSQLFQDLWALWNAGQKRGGYFVEVGAASGVYLSNTYLLEIEMGWTGVLAEPNPRFHASLAAHRRCKVATKCVYSRSGDTIEFLASPHGELSRIAAIEPGDGHEERRRSGSEQITVQTITLTDLLAEAGAPRDIDFLSIDTEGSEHEILSVFDFDRWNIAAIAVEHNGTFNRERLYELLTAKGYRRQWPELSRYDDWYVRR
jgi:FkbM family methyltransferase